MRASQHLTRYSVKSPSGASRMKRLRRLVLFLVVPVVWFNAYILVNLLTDKKSTWTAMELAYHIHHKQDHLLPKNAHAFVHGDRRGLSWNENQPGLSMKGLEQRGDSGDDSGAGADGMRSVLVQQHNTTEDPVEFPPFVATWALNYPGMWWCRLDRCLKDFIYKIMVDG